MKNDFAFVVSSTCFAPFYFIGVGTVVYNFLGMVYFVGLDAHLLLQEFSDPRDADDARYSLDGRDFDGRRIVVEFSRGVSSMKVCLLAISSCKTFFC